MTIQTPPYGTDGEEEVIEPSEPATPAPEPETPDPEPADPDPEPTEDEPTDPEPEEEEEISLSDWYAEKQAEFEKQQVDFKKQGDEIAAGKDEIAKKLAELDEQKKEQDRYTTKRNQEVTELARQAGVGDQFKDLKATERDVRKEGGVSSLWEYKEYYSKDKPPMIPGGTDRQGRQVKRPATADEIDAMNSHKNTQENKRLLELEGQFDRIIESKYPAIKEMTASHAAMQQMQPWFKTGEAFSKDKGIEKDDPVWQATAQELVDGGHFMNTLSDDQRMFIVEGIYNQKKADPGLIDKQTKAPAVKPIPKGADKFKIKRTPPPSQVGSKGGSSGTSPAPVRKQGRPFTPKEIAKLP